VREKYFSGNYRVKFGHFSGKYHAKFWNFVTFFAQISLKKFGHFYHFRANII